MTKPKKRSHKKKVDVAKKPPEVVINWDVIRGLAIKLKDGEPVEPELTSTDPLGRFFEKEGMKQESGTTTKYRGQDMSMVKTVEKMLFGPVNPRKKVKHITAVIAYTDGTSDTIFRVRSSRVEFDARVPNPPRFDHLERHLWPEFIEFDEELTLHIVGHVKARPSKKLAARLKEARKTLLGPPPL